jgi:hypothetical protein
VRALNAEVLGNQRFPVPEEKKMIDKSKDEIRAGMNPIERRILEREEGEARWRTYLKRREILRQRPVEEVIEEAYEANETLKIIKKNQ